MNLNNIIVSDIEVNNPFIKIMSGSKVTIKKIDIEKILILDSNLLEIY